MFNIYNLSIAILFLVAMNDGKMQSKDNANGSNRIVLGGLFPIRAKSENSVVECDKEVRISGLQTAHAMLYAITKLNKDDKILPNITLCPKIYDTCKSQTIAASHTRDFVKMTIVPENGAQFAGVVGATVSGVSANVARILQVFQISQVSYFSTSSSLSDKELYSYFLRTVPPDTFQAQAMVDICEKYGWKSVLTVNSEGIYGTTGIDAFHKLAQASNMCIDHIASLAQLAKREDYANVVEKLVEKRKGTSVSVVILFCTNEHSYGITREALKSTDARGFTWIASDAFDTTKLDLSGVSLLTVKLGISSIPQEFKDYFESLTPSNARWIDVVYIEQLWRQLFKCESRNTSATNLTKCAGNESLQSVTFGYTKPQSILNAVYVFAHALDRLQKELCPGQRGVCAAMLAFKRERLFAHLKNVSFVDSEGEVMEFNRNGEVNARYEILNFQEHNSHKSYVKVGVWRGGVGLNISGVKWHEGNATAPSSYCSPACSFGHVKQTMFEYPTCCWTCHACAKLTIIVNDTCVGGPVGYVPNANRTKWIQREILYMKWTDRTAIVFIAISLLSILLTLLTLLVFCVFHNNHVIKAAGRELCYIILTGILLCFVTPFLYIAKPRDVVCYVRRPSTGLGLAMIYAALFMKINRVYRVFVSARRSSRPPSLVRPKSQILITVGLVFIQVILTELWFMAKPVHAAITYYNEDEDLVLECKVQPIHFLVSLSYVIVLMILSTVYAFKTRKFPKNFNESKYIGITLYTTCTVYIIFFAFFLNMKDKMAVDPLIAGLNILTGLITLVGLFAQKVFIVVYVGETRVEDASQRSSSCKDGNTESDEERPTTKTKREVHVKDTGVKNKVKVHVRRSESF